MNMAEMRLLRRREEVRSRGGVKRGFVGERLSDTAWRLTLQIESCVFGAIYEQTDRKCIEGECCQEIGNSRIVIASPADKIPMAKSLEQWAGCHHQPYKLGHHHVQASHHNGCLLTRCSIAPIRYAARACCHSCHGFDFIQLNINFRNGIRYVLCFMLVTW